MPFSLRKLMRAQQDLPYPDLFSLDGKRKLLILTLDLVMFSFLVKLGLQTLYAPGQLSEPGPWLSLLLLGLLLLAARQPWPLMFSVLLGLLALLPLAWFDLQRALMAGTLPTGMSLWTPAIIVVVFLLLGSAAGLLIVGVLGTCLVLGLLLAFPSTVEMQQAWINLLLSSLLLTWLGYSISCFLERVHRQQVSSSAALIEARQDALTRVLGRAAIEDELESALEQAQLHQRPLSLVICDIDHFKSINDRYGHVVGDQVLRAVARILRHCVSQGGYVGRWGGEEFLLVLPISKTDALVLAEQVRRDIQNRETAGKQVTVSLGVASYRNGESLMSVFNRADQRLYEAKRQGRNTVR